VHALLGPGSVNAGLIRGGPPPSLRWVLERPPFEADAEGPLVATLREAVLAEGADVVVRGDHIVAALARRLPSGARG
jgi:hypothetical protein